MAKRGYIPTIQEVQDIYNRADSGDANALRELGDLNNKLAKRANERMRDIERKGLSGTQAYNRAKYFIEESDFTSTEYFSQSRKLSPEELYENIDQVTQYLRSQTSTAAGEIKRREKILDKLEENNAGFFDDLGDDREETKRQLLEFFDTDAWAEIRKNNQGGTNPVVAQAVEAINAGANINDLKRAFKAYKQGANTDLIEMWDKWTTSKSFGSGSPRSSMYFRSGQWHERKSPRR